MSIEINTSSRLRHSCNNPRQCRTPLPISTRKAWLPIRIFWRIRQFVRGVAAHVEAEEMLVVARALPKAALCRFCAMPLDGQRHSLNVYYALQQAGWYDPDLAAAALLHDVGKVAGDAAGIFLSPWLRGPLVLLSALFPGKVADLAVDDSSAGWRYLLHVHQQHPSIGAAWAREDHCSELTCWLIAHHQQKLDGTTVMAAQRRDELLALLQWADSRN